MRVHFISLVAMNLHCGLLGDVIPGSDSIHGITDEAMTESRADWRGETGLFAGSRLGLTWGGGIRVDEVAGGGMNVLSPR
jgi:hypothetical protein